MKVCTLTTVGANIFTYDAFDASANHNVLNMLDTIYYYPSYNDTARPQITRVLPLTNTVTAGIVTIKLTVTDTSDIDSVTVNAKRAILQSGNDYLATCTLSTGINRFTYKAYDKSIWHNVQTKADSITFAPLDTNKPVVTITSPAANITVNTGTYMITLTVTDVGGTNGIRFNSDSISTWTGTSYNYTVTYWANLSIGANVYRIYARDFAGNVDSSKTVTITYNTPPTVPTLFTPVTVSATSITVRWTKSTDPDFSRYKLFWGLSASVGEGNALGIDSAITTNSDTVRTLSALTPATIYYFKVAVRDGFPSTTYSSVVMDTTPLPAPTITRVTIQPTAPFAPRITWTKAPGATRYDVRRSTSSTFSSYEAIGATLAVNDTTLLDTSSGVPYAAGTKYYYRVVASNSLVLNSQSGVDSVTTWQATAFTTQPASQTKMVGQNVVFTVVASGFPAPTYQWKKNGNTISGETGASYTIGAVSFADSGLFTVTASNSMNSITSNPARLATVDSILVDIEGNVYHTVIIGNQVWTKENLRVTKYNDNSSIPLVTNNTTWINLSTPGYCFYQNSTDTTYQHKWGAFYNWYAVNTGKLAPAGWHVPTDSEWVTLQNYLIANGFNYDNTTTENKIVRSLAAKTDWLFSGAVGADLTLNNSSGFSALPSGYRQEDGGTVGIGTHVFWWSATAFSYPSAIYSYELWYNNFNLDRRTNAAILGFSVRLVRN